MITYESADVVINGVPLEGFVGVDISDRILAMDEMVSGMSYSARAERAIQRREASRLIDTQRKPAPFTNPRFICQACGGMTSTIPPAKMQHAEYFAQTGEPHFFALCPHCWRGLPKSVRAHYVRK